MSSQDVEAQNKRSCPCWSTFCSCCTCIWSVFIETLVAPFFNVFCDCCIVWKWCPRYKGKLVARDVDEDEGAGSRGVDPKQWKKAYAASEEAWTPWRTFFFLYYLCRLSWLLHVHSGAQPPGTAKDGRQIDAQNLLSAEALNEAGKACRARLQGETDTIRTVATFVIAFLFQTFVNPPNFSKDGKGAYIGLVGTASMMALFVMLMLGRFRSNMDYCPCAPELLAFIHSWEHVLSISYVFMLFIALCCGAAILVAGLASEHNSSVMIWLSCWFGLLMVFAIYNWFSMWQGKYGSKALSKIPTKRLDEDTHWYASKHPNLNLPEEEAWFREQFAASLGMYSDSVLNSNAHACF